MSNEKTSWREWVIYVKGVGPIARTNTPTRGVALLMKQQHWPTNDLYEVRRVRITLDPEKRS